MKQNIDTNLIKLYKDVAFKRIFGRDEQSKHLLKLLNAVIGYDGFGPVFLNLK